jgi:hypothetical protein
MMKDQEFLQWIYSRLEQRYEVDAQTDYMRKLAAIINATDPEQFTPNVTGAQGESNEHRADE